jgi:HSP20 family protein
MTTMVEPFAPWLRDLNRVFTSESRPAPFVPPADVIVSDAGVTVVMDVPGIRGEQLDVELENDVLTVRGERPYPYGNDAQAPVRRLERGFGRFERTLRVTHGLDPEAIEASLVDGVLTLQLPKPESHRPRRIQIRGEQPSGQGAMQPGAQGAMQPGGGQPPAAQPGAQPESQPTQTAG